MVAKFLTYIISGFHSPLRFFSINPTPFSESSSFTIFTHVGLEHPKSSIIFSIEYTIYALFCSSNQPFLIERDILSSIRPYNSFASLYNFLNLLSLIRSLGIRSKKIVQIQFRSNNRILDFCPLFFSSQLFTVKALFMIKHPKILCFKIKKGINPRFRIYSQT